MNDDIRETMAPLIDAVSKAWDQMVHQVDEVLRWSPGPAPAGGSPATMADGELGEALLAIAFGLIDTIDPVRVASAPAAVDPRWRFNLPATVETHVRAMFTEASHAFRLAVTGLRDHASLADLTAVGRLADILVRARWLLEPSEEGLRRERAYALTAEAIGWFRAMSDRSAEAGGHSDRLDLPGEIADRATTMAAKLAELTQEDGLREVRVPKRRRLFEAHLPGSGLTLFALSAVAASRPGSAPSALFYTEQGTGNALYNFQRLHVTRAYWLAQAIMLYADLCDAAAPVLGQPEWQQIIAAVEARLRPLGEEADRRYQQRLHRGIHPGL